MRAELFNRLAKMDSFIKQHGLEKKINPREEIFFILIHLLKIQEQDLDEDLFLNHLLQKMGREILDNVALYEQYSMEMGLVMEALMESFYEEMDDPEVLHRLTLEIGEDFAQRLSDKRLEELVGLFVDKIEQLSENDEMMAEPEVAQMITQFISPVYIEELLNLEKKETIALLFTMIMQTIGLIGLLKGEIGFEDEEPQESIGLVSKERTPANEPIYNPANLRYALGVKPLCNLCDKTYSPKGLKRHINSCITKSYTQREEELYYLVIKGDAPEYYLHIAIKPYTQLADLDSYLRDVWLECCGHMSEFFIGRHPIPMEMSVDEVFFRVDKIEYVYDFGSSTHLTVEFVKAFDGKQPTLIETLSRNPLPKIKCSHCGSVKVVAVCGECLYEGRGNLCKKCLPKHECGLDMVLPYVNSPRYGVCGYGSWENVHDFSEEELDKIYEEVEGNG